MNNNACFDDLNLNIDRAHVPNPGFAQSSAFGGTASPFPGLGGDPIVGGGSVGTPSGADLTIEDLLSSLDKIPVMPPDVSEADSGSDDYGDVFDDPAELYGNGTWKTPFGVPEKSGVPIIDPGKYLDQTDPTVPKLVCADDIRRKILGIANICDVYRHVRLNGGPIMPVVVAVIGEPGTGRRSAARLIADELQKRGHFFPVNNFREYCENAADDTPTCTANNLYDLYLAAYLGGGGVVFIRNFDEYIGDPEGEWADADAVEAILTCVKRYAGTVVTILSGCPEESDRLFRRFPDLNAVLTERIDLEPVSADGMTAIFLDLAKRSAIELGEGCREELDAFFSKLIKDTDGFTFNGREPELIFRLALYEMAKRCAVSGVSDIMTLEDLRKATGPRGASKA